MMDNGPLIVFPALLLTALIALSCWLLGISQEADRWKKETVSRGYGEYVLVDGGPKTEFKWKEKP